MKSLGYCSLLAFSTTMAFAYLDMYGEYTNVLALLFGMPMAAIVFAQIEGLRG